MRSLLALAVLSLIIAVCGDRVPGRQTPVEILTPRERIVTRNVAAESSLSVNASPASSLPSPSWVTVSWTGVDKVSKDDVIGVFTSGTPCSDPMQVVPTNAASSGSIKVLVVGLREQSYDFRYMSGGKTGTCLSTSNEVTFNTQQDTQFHLSLTDTEGEMVVMWVSGISSPTTLSYWTSSGDKQSATSSVSTYNVSQLCSSPANSSAGWRDPGFIHRVKLTNLESETTYTYSTPSMLETLSYTLNTPPTVGEQGSKPVEYLLYGDLGVAPWYGESGLAKDYTPANGTVELLTKLVDPSKQQIVLHIGDISYARGYAWQWDQFFTEIEPVAARLPYMVGIGNHEYDYLAQPFKPSWSNYGHDSGGECGVPYNNRFDMPGPGGNKNMYYSFNHGQAHFVIMSCETDFTEGSPQYKFIAADLAAVNKTQTPLIIFSGHRPMYTSSEHKAQDGIIDHMRAAYEPLFAQYGVQLALWGHVHQYERTCAVNNQVCDTTNGTVHVVIGNAGNDYQKPWLDQPSWSEYRSLEFGFSRLSFFQNNTAYFEFLANKDASVLDSFWINYAS